MTIKPVPGKRNKFTNIEKTESIETYSRMNRNIDQSLDETDAYAESTTKRMTHKEVFGKLRRHVNG